MNFGVLDWRKVGFRKNCMEGTFRQVIGWNEQLRKGEETIEDGRKLD